MAAFRSLVKTIIPAPVFRLAAPIYHFGLAFLAAVFYGFPSRGLTVIGVTGTDGKTTVVHLLHEMFAAAGERVGSLSSLRFKINGQEEANLLKMTMPGRFRLQRFLAECKRAGCRFAVIEVTSQGIAQLRHRFIRFQAALFTNVTPEHTESHGGFERYRAVKLKLFSGLPRSGFAVLNRDDPSAALFEASTPAAVVWYSRSSIEFGRIGHPVRVGAVTARRIQLELDGVLLETSLGGAFNVGNILAATAAAMAFGVSLSAIASALERLPSVPGRFEFVREAPFAVVVDYANTPAAYAAVYRALGSNLVCVFGAPGGGRDRWKRPELGRVAGQFCKYVILTSDDPDDEDPALIAEEIRAGMTEAQSQKTQIVLDRREAIRAALGRAEAGDTVVITGMGAQPWLIARGGKIPWDEREVVREELIKLRL